MLFGASIMATSDGTHTAIPMLREQLCGNNKSVTWALRQISEEHYEAWVTAVETNVEKLFLGYENRNNRHFYFDGEILKILQNWDIGKINAIGGGTVLAVANNQFEHREWLRELSGLSTEQIEAWEAIHVANSPRRLMLTKKLIMALSTLSVNQIKERAQAILEFVDTSSLESSEAIVWLLGLDAAKISAIGRSKIINGPISYFDYKILLNNIIKSDTELLDALADLQPFGDITDVEFRRKLLTHHVENPQQDLLLYAQTVAQHASVLIRGKFEEWKFNEAIKVVGSLFADELLTKTMSPPAQMIMVKTFQYLGDRKRNILIGVIKQNPQELFPTDYDDVARADIIYKMSLFSPDRLGRFVDAGFFSTKETKNYPAEKFSWYLRLVENNSLIRGDLVKNFKCTWDKVATLDRVGLFDNLDDVSREPILQSVSKLSISEIESLANTIDRHKELLFSIDMSSPTRVEIISRLASIPPFHIEGILTLITTDMGHHARISIIDAFAPFPRPELSRRAEFFLSPEANWGPDMDGDEKAAFMVATTTVALTKLQAISQGNFFSPPMGANERIKILHTLNGMTEEQIIAMGQADLLNDLLLDGQVEGIKRCTALSPEEIIAEGVTQFFNKANFEACMRKLLQELRQPAP